MQAFDAYKLYLALKSHFTSKSYDYFKYRGAISANARSFEKRHDRYQFTKLAKQKDLANFLTANMVYGSADTWVGDLVGNDSSVLLYKEFLKVRDSLAYVFTQDLEKLDDDVFKNITVNEGQHPLLLKLVLQKEIHIETFIILNDLWSFTKKWNREIADSVIWPDFFLKCKKYRPFILYDREKFMQIALQRFKAA